MPNLDSQWENPFKEKKISAAYWFNPRPLYWRIRKEINRDKRFQMKDVWKFICSPVYFYWPYFYHFASLTLGESKASWIYLTTEPNDNQMKKACLEKKRFVPFSRRIDFAKAMKTVNSSFRWLMASLAWDAGQPLMTQVQQWSAM